MTSPKIKQLSENACWDCGGSDETCTCHPPTEKELEAMGPLMEKFRCGDVIERLEKKHHYEMEQLFDELVNPETIANYGADMEKRLIITNYVRNFIIMYREKYLAKKEATNGN